MAHALANRMLPQHRGKECGIEVIGIVQRPEKVGIARPLGPMPGIGHPLLHGDGLRERHVTRRPEQPVRQQLRYTGPLARHAERMKIVIGSGGPGRTHPVVEPDALLEGRVAFAQETGLVDPDRRECSLERWKSRFAHADDADVGGFDQRDAQALPRRDSVGARKERRRDPPGGASPDDQYALDRFHSAVTLAARTRVRFCCIAEEDPGEMTALAYSLTARSAICMIALSYKRHITTINRGERK